MQKPILYYNGHLLTQDPNLPSATAFVVQNGRFVSVGKDEDYRLQSDQYGATIDLQQKTVIPAFHDAHIHIWKVGHLLTTMLDLRGIRSIKEIRQQLLDFASRYPEAPWLLARGFNEALLEEQRFPNRFDLDAAVGDRPVYMIRTCAHQAIVNTKALEIAGIHADTPIPAGGEILLLPDGSLAGHFTETAMGLITRHFPPFTATEYRRMILAAQDALLKAGITAACDPAVLPDLLEVYKDMDRRGELKISINAIATRVPDGATEALPLPEPYESDCLKIDSVKFFADGGLSGKTAAMNRCYKNTQEYGVLRLKEDLFEKWALEAHRAGLRIATHAIGDAAMEMVVRVYTRLNLDNPMRLRHRIEHVGFPSPYDLEQMRQQGIFAIMQPVFLWELGRNFKKYLDDDYLSRTYPCRSVLERGVDLAFSSDAPVVRDFHPLTGLRAAMDRRDADGFIIAPDQSITLPEALYAYTMGSASACGDEAVRGSITPGKRADFIVLEAPLEQLVAAPEPYVSGKPIGKVYRGGVLT
jgi:predicted amidohydrolase YtcJ